MANPFSSTGSVEGDALAGKVEVPSAFRKRMVVDEIPAPISSLASYKDHLYVGTKDGHLYQYALSRKTTASGSTFGKLKSFPSMGSMTRASELQVISRRIQSKKEVSKIQVIPQFQLLLVLCGEIDRTQHPVARDEETKFRQYCKVCKVGSAVLRRRADFHVIAALCCAEENPLPV